MKTPTVRSLFAGTAITLVQFATAVEPIVPSQPTEGYLPRFTRTVQPAVRELVRVHVEFPEDSNVQNWPVTFGVPFPRGALRSAANVRMVTAEKAPVPAQIASTATWHRPGGDVRWILVDMPAARGQDYFVEYGTAVTGGASRSVSPLRVLETAGMIEVATGPLKATFSRTRSHLVDAVWFDTNNDGVFVSSEQVVQARSRMFMVDQAGTRFESSDAPDDYELTLETRGPQRVVIKATGWYRDVAGTGLCRYVTRTHLYAGQAFVRVVHTFIVCFDTDRTQLRDIAIPLDLVGRAGAARFGAVGAPTTVALPACLVQETADRFVLKDGDGRVEGTGTRADGWALLTPTGDGESGIGMALRNIWQDYPKEIEARADMLVAHLWPAHSAEPLDFRAPAALGPKAYEAMGKQVYWRHWYKGGLENFDQAMGAAKTNDLLLAFGPMPAARDAVQVHPDPPFAVADPAWMCESDVFGPLHPRDPARFADIENKYDAAFGRYEYLRAHIDNYDRIGNYGFFDYGDVNYNTHWHEETRTWRPHGWRRMASRFYGLSLMPWIQYARTGARRYRNWAIDNARHVMDIDMTHVTAKLEGYPYPKYEGGRFGGNGGIIHYAGDVYDIGCDSHVAPWAYFYYLTGDRRAWDVLLEEGEFYLKAAAEGRAGPYQRYLHRMTGGALRVMVQLWWATWDQRYLDYARRLADFCYAAAAADANGVIRHDDVYMNPGLVTYYQATGDERMKSLFLHCMRELNKVRMPLGDPRAFTFYGPSMAYYFTGDPSYLARSIFWLRQYQEELNVGDDPQRRGIPAGHWDTCHNCLQLVYGPYLLGALAGLEKLPEPAANLTGTGSEVWLDKEDAGGEIEMLWRVYQRPHFWGVPVGNWPQYCERHRPTATLAVYGPDGSVAAGTTLQLADTPHGGRVALRLPAGTPGLYRLGIVGPQVAPIKLLPISIPVSRWGYSIRHGSISHVRQCWFGPEPGVGEMTVRYKLFGLRTEQRVRLLDPDGRVLEEATHRLGSMPPGAWTRWSVSVPAAARGKLWCLEFVPVNSNVQEVLLRIDGALPVISTGASRYFVPERIPPAAPAAAPAPPNVPGLTVREIAAGQAWNIERGMTTGQGKYAHLCADAGTIEFWFCPEWDPEDLVDRDILRCGQLRLFRRSQLGTYISLFGSYQAGFVLQPQIWHHLAVVWNFVGPEPERRLQLFVDGIPFGHQAFGQISDMGGDWTGDVIDIGSTVLLRVGGLQISAVPRHQRLGQGVFSPPPDAHTLYTQGAGSE